MRLLKFAWLLIVFISSCVGLPQHNTITFQVEHLGDKYEVKQDIYRKGDYITSMGNPVRSDADSVSFDFFVSDINNIDYVILSVESWNISRTEAYTSLNGEFLFYLPDSKAGGVSSSSPDIPRTYSYIPLRALKKGNNTLVIETFSDRWSGIAIKNLDVIIVSRKKVDSLTQKGVTDTMSSQFPDDLSYLGKLNTEELYILHFGIPDYYLDMDDSFAFKKQNIAYAYSKIGDYYRWLGDYSQSLHYQQLASASVEIGKDELIYYYVKLRLALAYYYTGYSEKAIDICNYSLSDIKSFYSAEYRYIPDHKKDFIVQLVTAYKTFFHFVAGNISQAHDDCLASLYFTQGQLAYTLYRLTLANISLTNHQYKKAAKYFENALWRIKENKYHADLLSVCRLGMAQANRMIKDYKGALEQLKTDTLPFHEFRWQANYIKGLVYLDQFKINLAEKYFRESINDIEESRKKFTISQFKLDFMNDKIAPYDELIKLLLHQKRYKDAFEIIEMRKARSFLESIAHKVPGSNKDNPGYTKFIQQEKILRTNILKLRKLYEYKLKVKGDTPDTKQALQDMLHAQNELDDYYDGLKASKDKYISLRYPQISGIDEISNRLMPDTTLLEYYYFKGRLVTYIINSDGFEVVDRSIAEERLQDLVYAFRDKMVGSKTTRGVAQDRKTGAVKIRNKHYVQDKDNPPISELLLPEAIAKSRATRLVVVPFGFLHFVPFHALSKNGKFLVEKYPLSYLPSASSIRYTNIENRPRVYSLLGMGNPALDKKYSPLPFAQKEVEDISKYFKEAKHYTGNEATETRFKQSVDKYDVVHLATHGLFEPYKPMNTALLLSKNNIDDGRVKIEEIIGLDIKASMVAMSACNTGLGDINNSDDIVGLTKSFMIAGAKNVMSTLWRIEDRASSELMKEFYKYYRDKPADIALQMAQKKLINNPAYNHPIYWAGYKISGVDLRE